jgi:hypothetical protein
LLGESWQLGQFPMGLTRNYFVVCKPFSLG